MADYFISPKEKSDLRLDLTEFAEAVARRWPGVTYLFPKEGKGPYGLRWTVPMPQRRLDGALNRAGQSIVLDGDLRDAAEFARWVRRQVPQRYPLFFYDEGYSADVALIESTSAEELVQPFLVQS